MFKKALIGWFALTLLAVSPCIASADSGGGGASGGSRGTGGTVHLENPVKVKTFPELFKKVLDAAFVIGLPIAVLFIVLAGFRFVAARGNSDKLKTARNNLLWTVIGIAIFFGAWVLANIVANTLCSLGADICS